jgi:hypothetical protein
MVAWNFHAMNVSCEHRAVLCARFFLDGTERQLCPACVGQGRCCRAAQNLFVRKKFRTIQAMNTDFQAIDINFQSIDIDI